MNRQWMPVRAIVSFLIAGVLVLGMVGCGDRALTANAPGTSEISKTQIKGTISEVSPPEVIQQLRSYLDVYKPQVTIISPKTDEILADNTVEVRFQVQDLPIFKDSELGLGPHLNVILDNQPYQAVYDLNQPLVFKDLAPGTHTLRVFASRPWDESFKNEGAYAQTSFHIFTKTPNNNPDPNLPVLTYSSPTGTYGAEPILLDFYLTNAPLHLAAQENAEDEIADWRIRVTANGQSFVIDRWQPLYLKGFKPGKNWVQLEFIDEKGNQVNNVFNNTVGILSYEPKGRDTLAKLVRGEVKLAEVKGIVDPNYKAKPIPTPTPEVIKTPTPTPTGTPTPTPMVSPTVAPEVEIVPTPTVSPTVTPEVETVPTPETVPQASKDEQKPKSGGLFDRFRRPTVIPTPSSTPPQVIETPSPLPESVESPEEEVTPTETQQLEKTSPVPSAEVKVPEPETVQTPTPQVETNPPVQPQESEKLKYSRYLERYRRNSSGTSVGEPNKPEAKSDDVQTKAESTASTGETVTP